MSASSCDTEYDYQIKQIEKAILFWMAFVILSCNFYGAFP